MKLTKLKLPFSNVSYCLLSMYSKKINMLKKNKKIQFLILDRHLNVHVNYNCVSDSIKTIN